MANTLKLGRHTIGLGHPTYFVADIAANHDGSLERARELIHLCADAGAQAAKFQNFRAETIVSGYGFESLDSQLSHQATWKKDVVEVYREASLPLEWTPALRQACDEAGIDYFTSPYSLDLIDALSKYVCAWKVGSGEVTWHELIRRMAEDGKPLLIATGASNMDEVRAAVFAAAEVNRQLVLMQCNTNYTASHENFRYVALNVLKTYASEFPDLILGLSDHTPGHSTVLGAVALGARVVEKHFTDDNDREGPDHRFSMTPVTWREMVARTRELEPALGPEEKTVMENERETVVIQRRALRASRRIRSGEVIRREDVIPLRPCPAEGLPPTRLSEILARRARSDIQAGACITLDDVE